MINNTSYFVKRPVFGATVLRRHRGCGIVACMAPALMIFTRDLRLHDNPALQAAISTSAQVIPCFVVDDEVLARYGSHATRLAFLADSLQDLDAGLRALGGGLVVRRGPWIETVTELARSAGATRIHLADDYSAYARRRLAGLETAARSHRIEVIRHPGVALVSPGELTPASGGSFFQVFTPYYRRWQATPLRSLRAAPAAVRLPDGLDRGAVPEPADLTTASPAADRPRGGETQGQERLRAWAGNGLAGYDTGRDDLAADSVSRLSPYLHLGCLSARTIVAELAGRPGSEAFMRQLAWRDFFHQVLAARPDAAWRDYRSRDDQWREDDRALRAWQDGQTGYPVVDAAMRQLRTEGFMHNRARMIVASFLTKDLYLDWRHGAAHFMRLLADGDIACNQLNWQWVAGTGTDTNAHRVFNPTLQGRRFDPGGDYLRRYVPELASLSADAIHEPDPGTRRRCGYPEPIVDHRAAVAEYRARRRRAG
jgi:deoxyribodipyrimidine photo-lyase